MKNCTNKQIKKIKNNDKKKQKNEDNKQNTTRGKGKFETSSTQGATIKADKRKNAHARIATNKTKHEARQDLIP